MTRFELFGRQRPEQVFGLPATGRKVSVGAVDIGRLRNGQAAERWGGLDSAALMQQLGVAPGQPEATS